MVHFKALIVALTSPVAQKLPGTDSPDMVWKPRCERVSLQLTMVESMSRAPVMLDVGLGSIIVIKINEEWLPSDKLNIAMENGHL